MNMSGQSLAYDWADIASTQDPEAPRGPSLLLELDPEDGQLLFTRHVAGMLRALDMRYCFGRNEVLFLTAEHSITQLENMFTDITLVTNESRDFDTIVTVDISALAEVIDEKPMQLFLTGIRKAARYAAILLIVRPDLIRNRRNTDKLIGKLVNTFADRLQVSKLSRHTVYEVNKQVLDCIEACDITLENKNIIRSALEQLRSSAGADFNPASRGEAQKGVL